MKCSEGLPRGIILPDDVVEEDKQNKDQKQLNQQNIQEQSYDRDTENIADDEEYFSAEEEDGNIETNDHKTKEVATQTDSIIPDKICKIM